MRIIVTGAARGIGRAIALKLARDVQRSGGRLWPLPSRLRSA